MFLKCSRNFFSRSALWLSLNRTTSILFIPDFSTGLQSSSLSPNERRAHTSEFREMEQERAQVAPIVRFEEVAVTTGEEGEDTVLDLKSKLYRFDKEGNQWEKRGAGTVKLLKHKQTGKARLVMRQSQTLKICANHFISSGMTVQENCEDKMLCSWYATDFSDGQLKNEVFCIRFASTEDCKTFMETFTEMAEIQQVGKKSADGLIENLLVDKSKEAEEKETNNVKEEEEQKTELSS